MSDRRGVGDTDFEVQGRDIQTRGSSACSSLNRCEPSLPNSIPARGVIKGHAQRPDTRPIEDPAERSKIMLAKQGESTHVMAYEMTLGGGHPPRQFTCELPPPVPQCEPRASGGTTPTLRPPPRLQANSSVCC